MGTFKKIISTLLLAFVFFCGMFVRVDISNNAIQNGLLGTLGSQQVHANSTTTGSGSQSGGQQSKDMENTFKSINNVLNAVLGFLLVVISPIILLCGWLMSPDWVTGDLFGLRDNMYGLWITVSNILYFVYAVFLIVIAVATIFNSQTYGYKQMLPRLLLGILLIPATWWFVQFIISTSTAVTASVLRVPIDMMVKQSQTDGEKNKFWDEKTIPKKIELDKLTSATPNCENGSGCISVSDVLKSGMGIYSPMLIYSYDVFKIQDLKRVYGSSGVDILKNVLDLANSLIFSTLLFLVFGILTIALVFILFMRAIKMWMYAIFSPLFTAKIVFKDWKDDASEMFSIKEFIGLAFVPAIIGLALSFGLIVVTSVRSGISTPNNSERSCNMTQQECILTHFGGNPNNKITAKIEGGTGGADGKTGSGATSVITVHFGALQFQHKGSLEAGAPVNVKAGHGGFLGAFGTIIVQFIALVFIWIAFIAASKVSKMVQTIVAPFENFGKSMADLGKSSIKMMPVPGIGNIGGLEKISQVLKTQQDTKIHNSVAASAIGQKMGMQVKDIKVENTINNAMNVTVKKDDTSSATEAGRRAGEAIKQAVDAGYGKKQIQTDVVTQLLSKQLGDDVNKAEINAYLTAIGVKDNVPLNRDSKRDLLQTINSLTPEQVYDIFVNKSSGSSSTPSSGTSSTPPASGSGTPPSTP